MKPSQIASLANHILEHGVNIKTRDDRLLAKTALEVILNAEVRGIIRMTRKNISMLEGMHEFIKKNL